MYIGGNINVHIWKGLGFFFICSRREIRYINNLVKNVVSYFVSILVLQSSWWGNESWLLCLVCHPGGVSGLLFGSPSVPLFLPIK